MTLEEDYLVHYGKKGMKWGVRKQTELSTRTSSTVSDPSKRRLRRNVAIGVGVGVASVGAAFAIKYGRARINEHTKGVAAARAFVENTPAFKTSTTSIFAQAPATVKSSASSFDRAAFQADLARQRAAAEAILKDAKVANAKIRDSTAEQTKLVNDLLSSVRKL